MKTKSTALVPLKFTPEYVEYCLIKNISLDDYIKRIEATEFFMEANLEYYRYWILPMRKLEEKFEPYYRPSQYKKNLKS